MDRLSQPIDELLAKQSPGAEILRADYVIVGSGYGGAIAALRLAHPDRSVVVLERGREYRPGDFPYDESDLPAHLRLVRGGSENVESEGQGYADALFNLHLGEEADVLVGSGLGGTSLINANVAEQPPAQVFQKSAWPHEIRSQEAPLADEFHKVAELLSVSAHPTAALAKYRALARLTESLDKTDGISAAVRPAALAVKFDNNPNNVGVTQRPCTDCGNCVTGCNTGAKGTLDRNILPLAKSRGAEIYTGVKVLTLRERAEEDYRWALRIAPTVQLKGTVRQATYFVLARNVILAAGTLGSTEILLRSRDVEQLGVSSRLGERFSTNGDGLIMSYGQTEAVNAVAAAEQRAPEVANRTGPTITGIASIRTRQSAASHTHLTLEEAAIPAAIARIFTEALTTSAQFQRLSDRKLPKFIKSSNIDPLVGSRVAARHSQVLLVMGDDGSKGNLTLGETAKGHELESVIQVAFPDAKKNSALVQANKLIKAQDRSKGLDGGQYVPNPMWELLPEEASGVLSGDLPKGRAVTVHPLGGCAMGDDIELGVVNHLGQVFKPGGVTSKDTYDGLYVMDGAIVPAALEVNPFLTIAALAYRNSGHILVSAGYSESEVAIVVDAYSDTGDARYKAFDRQPVDFVMHEQLIGSLSCVTPWLEAQLGDENSKRLAGQDGFVMVVEARFNDTESWLDQPGPVPARARLYVNMLSAEAIERMKPYGITRSHFSVMKPFAEIEGTFSLLREDRYNWFSDVFGAICAIFTYRRRRVSTAGFWRRPLREWLVFFNIGALQSRYRRMQYEFESDAVRIRGEKVLGYNRSLERLWQALLYLPIELKDKRHRKVAHGTLAVGLEDMVQSGILQLVSQTNLPRAITAAAGIGAWFARSIFSTSFWEFGGMDYPASRVTQQTRPRAIRLSDGRRVAPESVAIDVEIRRDSNERYPLLMTRYRNDDASRGPVLLLHGLAQGSQIFWTDSIDTNLAVFLYESGFDVFVADYRLSNHVLPGMHDRDWSMDEIAEFDIPAAINHVHEETGQPVTVFAHCVGACTLAMSVLAGKTDSGKIKAAALNAIHPFVVTSPANRVRARLGAFNRDWITTDILNPIPGPNDGVFQNVLDRIAHALSKVRELALDDHRDYGDVYGDDPLAEGICDRMSLLYGRMWNHKNLDPRTHAAFMHMLGPAPGGVYRHIYYYSLLKRITAADGKNRYLRADNIRNHWTFPTLFLHGEDSRVFNPYSAERSAAQFSKINPCTQFAALRIPHYGHMDVVFGKHAHRDVYGQVLTFYDEAWPLSESLRVYEAYVDRPRIGPILRAAWLRDGKIHLRYWAELNRSLTNPAVKLAVQGNSVKCVGEDGITGSDRLTQHGDPVRHRLLDVQVAEADESLQLELYGELKEPARNPDGVNLEYQQEAWYRRLREQAQGTTASQMSFLVGSCRFPGTIIDAANSDRVFGTMREHLGSAQLLFLVGDQIYADATDQLFQVKSLRAKFRYRYERAFSNEYSPLFADLVARIPTHFSLDDHEIEDEWAGIQTLPASPSALENQRYDTMARRSKFGVRMAKQFQSSGRDQMPIDQKYRGPFYYALSHPDETQFPCFVMDTRTERDFRASNDAAAHQLISEQQFELLTNWLCAAPADEPKFIISGSVVAPVPTTFRQSGANWRLLDGWSGYPATLERVMALIGRERIQHVVFVGGNEHFSAVASIDIGYQGQSTCAFQVIGSGLYAPMPFANSRPEDFDWDTRVAHPVLVEKDLTLNYTAHLLTASSSQFLKVTAGADQIVVNAYAGRGQPDGPGLVDPLASVTLGLGDGALIPGPVQS